MKYAQLLLGMLLSVSMLAQAADLWAPRARIAFVVMVGSPMQERDAALLIDSIRAFGGDAANAPVYAVLANPQATSGKLLRSRGARTVELAMDARFRTYPFADKVFACAQAEELAENDADVLVWVNPESLVVAPPIEAELTPRHDAAVRPVHIQNVGLAIGEKPDVFWAGIYKAAGLSPRRAFPVESFVDARTIHAYFNSGFFAVRPQRGILRQWRKTFEQLVENRAFQAVACADDQHKVFLHQAVLSALLVARLGRDRILVLPPTYSYPLNFHDDLPPERRAKTVNSLVHMLANQSLRDPHWVGKLPIEEPVRAWLRQRLQDEPLQVAQSIYRAEGSCNSYLVETADGNVLIDPGSAGGPSSPLLAINNKPVKTVLLTHGHPDHIVQIAAWRQLGVPVVAQREYADLQNYELRIAAFNDPRESIQAGGSPFPVPPSDAAAGPSVFFTDTWVTEVGGIHFEAYHTGGETPDQSVIWIPERKAVFIGDNFYTSFPNIYTLRGTRPRWALDYVKALDKALELHPDILLPGHGEPVAGADKVQKQLTRYRDAILYVHDATVRGMNEGKDVYTLMRAIKLPPELALPEFFGRVSWSVRGIYDGYAGWFDGNPANMYAEPADAIYPELVRLAGSDAIGRRALELAESGDSVAALRLSEVVLTIEPAQATALKARFTALEALRKESRNGIEIGWLDHSIQVTKAALSASARASSKAN